MVQCPRPAAPPYRLRPRERLFASPGPWIFSSRAVSARPKVRAAASAEYSPSEWPATNAQDYRTDRCRLRLPCTRRTAMLTAISAGCAFSVRVQVLRPDPGPSVSTDSGSAHRRFPRAFPVRRRMWPASSLAHANRLRALARKHKCTRHTFSSPSFSACFRSVRAGFRQSYRVVKTSQDSRANHAEDRLRATRLIVYIPALRSSGAII